MITTDAPLARYWPTKKNCGITTTGHELRARQWAHLCIRCLTRVKPDVRRMASLGWRFMK